MLELHYPTVTKTILERQYPGKPTLKVAFGNDNGAIFENSSKLRASLFVTSRWPRSSGQTNYQVHHPPLVFAKSVHILGMSEFCVLTCMVCSSEDPGVGFKARLIKVLITWMHMQVMQQSLFNSRSHVIQVPTYCTKCTQENETRAWSQLCAGRVFGKISRSVSKV